MVPVKQEGQGRVFSFCLVSRPLKSALAETFAKTVLMMFLVETPEEHSFFTSEDLQSQKQSQLVSLMLKDVALVHH